MIALYLDYELNDEERQHVESALTEPVETRRVPWLAPPGTTDDDEPLRPEQLLPHLTRIGIDHLADQRLLLVAPADPRWYTGLVEAVRLLTGAYPLLIQPEARRAEVGAPGPLRILDIEAYMLGEDTDTVPPWMREEAPDEEKP